MLDTSLEVSIVKGHLKLLKVTGVHLRSFLEFKITRSYHIFLESLVSSFDMYLVKFEDQQVLNITCTLNRVHGVHQFKVHFLVQFMQDIVLQF